MSCMPLGPKCRQLALPFKICYLLQLKWDSCWSSVLLRLGFGLISVGGILGLQELLKGSVPPF